MNRNNNRRFGGGRIGGRLAVPGESLIRGGSIASALFKTIGKEKNPEKFPPYPDEKHITFLDGKDKGIKAHFAGPGTHIKERVDRGDPPINDVDNIARNHDISYMLAQPLAKVNKTEFMKKISEADRVFINDMKATKDAPITANIAAKAIALKMFAEKTGILPSTVFSGGRLSEEGMVYARKYMKPAEMLEYELKPAVQKIKGGFLPLLLAALPAFSTVATWIAAGATTAAAGYLTTKALEKIGGKGLKGGSLKNPVDVMKLLTDKQKVEVLADTINKFGHEAFKPPVDN